MPSLVTIVRLKRVLTRSFQQVLRHAVDQCVQSHSLASQVVQISLSLSGFVTGKKNIIRHM